MVIKFHVPNGFLPFPILVLIIVPLVNPFQKIWVETKWSRLANVIDNCVAIVVFVLSSLNEVSPVKKYRFVFIFLDDKIRFIVENLLRKYSFVVDKGTEIIEYNIGIMRSFPKGNLDGVEGATQWRLERNRIVAVKFSRLRSGRDVRVIKPAKNSVVAVVFSKS